MKANKRFIFGLVLLIIVFAISFLYFFASNSVQHRASTIINIKIPKKAEILESYNTYGGGIHGDGEFYAVFDLSSKEINELKNKIEVSNEWNSIPLTTEQQQLANTYLKKPQFTESNNGYYLFIDNNNDDTPLLERYSYNVIFSILDLDQKRLYVLQYDS